jgi:hypothetical protein
LVVLPGDLRTAAAVAQQLCGAERPPAIEPGRGRGGQPQDPDATLPTLYIAERDMNATSPMAGGPPPPIRAQQTTARLTMHCGREP